MTTRLGWTRAGTAAWSRGEWRLERTITSDPRPAASWHLYGPPPTKPARMGRTLAEAMPAANARIREYMEAAVAALREAGQAAPTGTAGVGWICPSHPFGHDWAAGLTCRSCGAERSASEAITSGLASMRGWSPKAAAAVRDAHRLEVVEEVVALLRRHDRPASAQFLLEHLLSVAP